LAQDPAKIAHLLVHEYKDHGFVVDFDEAQSRLGAAWVLGDTPESAFADEFYNIFDFAEMLLATEANKNLSLMGALHQDEIGRALWLTDRK
jgi:hypothetical protein